MDHHQIAVFRRVEHVKLAGEKIGPPHLRQVSHFASLRTLDLSDTSLDKEAVQEWQRNHPRVEVTYYARSMVEPVKLSAL